MATDGIKLCVKQGEELNRVFTIKQGGSPMDLSNYTVRVQVKRQPLAKEKAIIDKPITTTTDINDVGQIASPQSGEVTLHLKEEDTSYPTGEYSLVITLEQTYLKDIISSTCCGKATYIICEQ